MLSFALLRRAAFLDHKILHSLCSSQRCCSSTLAPLSSPRIFSHSFSPTERLFLPPRLPLARPLHTSATCLKYRPIIAKKRPKPEPEPREEGLLRDLIEDLPNSPKPALYLGFSGLLPFVCPTLFMACTETFITEIAYAQMAYGASILSFLGGARWGFALPPGSPAQPDWNNLYSSVVPSVLAWTSMLMSVYYPTIVPPTFMVIIGLGLALFYDLVVLPPYPSWFRPLRAILTAVATVSLLGMMLIYGLYPEKRLLSEKKDN